MDTAPASPDDKPRAHHDMGGVSRFLCEEIETEPHELTAFDRQVDALRQLLSLKGLMTVDELRRGIEEIPEEEYLRLTYYQKWVRSITATLIRRGVLDEGEIAARLEGGGMRLAPGTAVAVKDAWPERDGPVHVRTPHYVRGKSGTVVRHLGDFPDPGDIAFERPPTMRELYHVAFPLRALFADATGDELVVEIYDHWLVPEGGQRVNVLEADSGRLFAVISGLLAEKGLVRPDEIGERVAVTDRASPALGAAIVARAWTDPAYRELLVRDGTAAAEAAGVAMRGMPPLGVLANEPGLHNVVVCTLCSCYPRAVLGYPPFWFKSPAYRARTVRDPRGVLADWGTTLPADTRIRVVDSTADYRWMVLPMRPEGTEGWPAERLAGLVRETDMIGVTVPSAGTRP